MVLQEVAWQEGLDFEMGSELLRVVGVARFALAADRLKVLLFLVALVQLVVLVCSETVSS